MDKDGALGIISQFQKALETRGVRINRLVLYGSYASGKFEEGSDIDLVVISDDFADKGYWDRIDIISDAIYEVFAPLEVVGMTREEWEKGDSFVVDYAKKGEIVYAA